MALPAPWRHRTSRAGAVDCAVNSMVADHAPNSSPSLNRDRQKYVPGANSGSFHNTSPAGPATGPERITPGPSNAGEPLTSNSPCTSWAPAPGRTANRTPEAGTTWLCLGIVGTADRLPTTSNSTSTWLLASSNSGISSAGSTVSASRCLPARPANRHITAVLSDCPKAGEIAGKQRIHFPPIQIAIHQNNLGPRTRGNPDVLDPDRDPH